MERQLDEALGVLGIPAGSDRETVTSAYRRLARATHPDVSTDPDAAERFAAVLAAYRLVSAVPNPGPRSQARPQHADDGAARAPDPGRGARQRLEAWPETHVGSWRQPPIVAGPVMVRRVQPDAGRWSRDG